MRCVILGAGAIGGVLASHLARAGREVLVIARGAHLDAIRAHGLRTETPRGSFVVPLEMVAAGVPIAWRAGDLLLVAVKTQDVASALAALAPPPHVPIACFTNGLEAERIALRFSDHVYGACVMMSATYLAAGVVQAWGAPVPGLFEIGRYPDGIGDHADELVGELNVAGFDCEVRPAVMRWKRTKLISNLANGADALCGPVARDSDLTTRLRAEGRACFEAAGLPYIAAADEQSRRGTYASAPIAGAAKSGGSTWQSLARHHTELEVDYLNGEIAMLGRLHGVPTPANVALQRIARTAARSGVAAGSMTVAALTAEVERAIATPG